MFDSLCISLRVFRVIRDDLCEPADGFIRAVQEDYVGHKVSDSNTAPGINFVGLIQHNHALSD